MATPFVLLLASPAGVVAGKGVAAGAVPAFSVPLMTERVPLMPGTESKRAVNIKLAAAPMVILESSVCVPRAPKAVVETVLEKSAPASALPGCNKTVATKTMQERRKRPNKM